MARVLFFCRGSVTDGLGHVMRSRRVAREMAKTHDVMLLVICDESACALVAHEAFECRVLDRDAVATAVGLSFAPDVVVFDLVELAEHYVEKLSAQALRVSLSPIFGELGRMHIVFHRTEVRGPAWPPENGGTEYLCGLQYAVIGEHCRKITEPEYRGTLSHNALAVAVSMGGGDAANRTLAVLERLKQVPDRLLLWVLLGEGYAHSYSDLVDCVRGSRHEIIMARTNDSMWRILSTCALVILAGGTTTYEAVYAGLPSINTLDTPAHRFLISELEAKGVCTSGGDTFTESLEKMPDAVGHVIRNRDQLLTQHVRCAGLIDGLGASRIAREIGRRHAAGITNKRHVGCQDA